MANDLLFKSKIATGGKMNLKFQKAQLVNALGIAMKAVSTKTSSVILESILITAKDNRVFWMLQIPNCQFKQRWMAL